MNDQVDERTFTYDLISYTTKWDSLQTSVVSVIQNLRDATSESITSSSKRQELLEAKLTSVAATQQVMVIKQSKMDERIKSINVRQDITGVDLKVVPDLLKKQYA